MGRGGGDAGHTEKKRGNLSPFQFRSGSGNLTSDDFR